MNEQSVGQIDTHQLTGIAQKMRTMSPPEVNQEPITWLRKDTLAKLMDRQDGTVGFSAVLFKKETEIHSVGLYLAQVDAAKKIEENQGLRLRLAAAENGTKEAAKAEQLYRDAEKLLTADEKQLHAELSALRNESEAFRQESAESDRVNYSVRCSLQADINDRDEIISNGKDRIRTLEAKVSELRTTLKTVMQMQVRGHQLQDRLQFSNAGREILGKVNAALKGGAA